MDNFLFQYCQKIVVFRGSAVLLCQRKNEIDYNGIFSFIGGKMERTDPGIVESLRREKNEEVGVDFQIEILPLFSINVFFTKKDGNSMILPHYYARYVSGEVTLNDEYSDYRWVELDELAAFQPVIDNVPWIARELYQLQSGVDHEKFVLL